MAGRGRPPLHREPVGASSASAEGDPPDAHHVRWSSIPATLRASGWTPLYGNARGQGQSERAATVAGLRGGCPSTRRLSASASCQIDRRSQWRIAAPAPKRPNSPRPVEDNGPIFVDEARDPDVLRMDLDAVAAFDRPALLTGGTESAPFFGPVVDMVAGPCRGPSASRSRAPTTRRRSASRHVASSWSRRLRSSGGPVGRAGVGPEASAWMRRFSGNASHLVGSADLWARAMDRRVIATALAAAVTTLGCAGLLAAAVLVPAPEAVLPLLIATGVGCPMLAIYQFASALSHLRRATTGLHDHRTLDDLRRELRRLPETRHPLGL
jgi:hypothetical protein